MPTFLCAGDPHLGSGAEYGRVPGERLEEQEAVLEKIVALANELDVDALLWAGDALEGPIPTPEHYRAFKRPLEKLIAPLIGVVGNGRHDSAMRRANALEVLGFDIAASPGVATDHPATICRLPWAPVSNLVAASGGGDRDEINFLAGQRLLEIARGLFIEAVEDRDARGFRPDEENRPAIVLLTHFSIEGAATPTGIETGVFREPVIPLGDLEAIGFDAIVAGHIHKPQRLDKSGRPLFYVGSPMPLNFGEASCDHGVWLLTVEPSKSSALFLPIESRRFETVVLTGREALETTEAEWPPWYDVNGAVVKIKIEATEDEARRLDVALLRREAEVAGAHHVWAVQMAVERAERRKVAGLDESLGEEQALKLYLEEQGAGPIEPIIDRTLTYLEEVRP